MLALALGKMRDPRALSILVDLLKDEEISGHAIIGLGKLGAAPARPYLEPFLDNSKSWIRNEAKKAIARIDRESAKAARRFITRRLQ